jgi:hypothetical protein
MHESDFRKKNFIFSRDLTLTFNKKKQKIDPWIGLKSSLHEIPAAGVKAARHN